MIFDSKPSQKATYEDDWKIVVEVNTFNDDDFKDGFETIMKCAWEMTLKSFFLVV